jgi:hypothetical protein
MRTGEQLSGSLVAALTEFAGVSVSAERARELAEKSQDLFAAVDRVSGFMVPLREVGMGVMFSPTSSWHEG